MLAQRMLLGTRVILCTISTITSARLAFITMQAPVECVIVDEASQIEIGQYLPLLSRYEKTLQKLVFIGDDKQRTSCPSLLAHFCSWLSFRQSRPTAKMI